MSAMLICPINSNFAQLEGIFAVLSLRIKWDPPVGLGLSLSVSKGQPSNFFAA